MRGVTMGGVTTRFKSFERGGDNSTQAYHYKVQGLDGKWYITYGSPVWNDVVKMGLTSEEANAFLKLLKEQ
jgi:hypothetical protein